MSTIFGGRTYVFSGKHFSCPAGWKKLVRKLYNDIHKVCKKNNDDFPPRFYFETKFGVLWVSYTYDHKFRYDTTKKEVWDLIIKATRDSNSICEVTGEPGSPCINKDGSHWMATLSEEKAKEFGYEKSTKQ